MSDLATALERWPTVIARILQGESTGLVAVALLYVLFSAVELAIPAEPGQSWSGRLRNLVYLAIFVGAGMSAMALWYAWPREPGSKLAFSRMSTFALLPAYVFASDFAYYWYHRAQHRFAGLWAIHELHHADSELNVTTSYRTYWLEAPVQAIVVAAPVSILLGAPVAAFALTSLLFSRAILLFAHSNLRLSLGRLTPVLCGPQWHRIHHSRLEQHRDRNFAQVFPIIDIIFGTYYRPAADEFPPTGTPELRSDAPLWQTQTRPLAIWRDLALRRTRAGRRPGQR